MLGRQSLKKPMLLKNQLIAGFLLVSFVPTLILSVFFTLNTNRTIENNYAQNRMRVISQIAGNVSTQTQWLRAIQGQLVFDTGITEILNRPQATAQSYDKIYGETINRITSQFNFTPIGNYVSALIIRGYNGSDIRFGRDAGNIEFSDIEQSNWFREASENQGIKWGYLTDNYSRFSAVKKIIPYYIQLNDQITGRKLGFAILLLDHMLFKSCYENLVTFASDQIYLAKENGELLSYNLESVSAGTANPDEKLSEMPSILINTYMKKVADAKGPAYEIAVLNRVTNLITYQQTDDGWLLLEILPLESIAEQYQVFLKFVGIIVLVAVVLSILLSMFLSLTLTRPIRGIVAKVREIGQGQFSQARKLSVVASNEMAVLNDSIDLMQKDIHDLMNENIIKEREKRNLEIQMLQNQINPHFLYNTLNTIKMMATLQGAEGIIKMLTALARILRFSLGQNDEMVSLASEIDVLEDYFLINRIRYKGRIKFEKQVEDQALLDCKVPRFILQPLVENAIQHGLGSSGAPGCIRIDVRSEGEKLLIDIEDNGVGMSEEQLEALTEKLRTPVVRAGSLDGGLGLLNVHNRIRLIYGHDYGITMDSRLGEFTRLTVVLKKDSQPGSQEVLSR